jgi:predicted nucleotidyltransferase
VVTTLASILFKDYRRRVLGLLLLHPDQSYHVREIARLTGTVAGTLHKELAQLESVGILEKKKTGNQLFYNANQRCPIYQELVGILKKTSGIVDVLSQALAPLADKIKIAFVFGSIAKGKETSASDVDVIVVGQLKFSDLVNALYPAQEIIQREINPKLFSDSEWQAALEQKNAFIKDVLTGPKLFIIGDENDLG